MSQVSITRMERPRNRSRALAAVVGMAAIVIIVVADVTLV